MKACFVALAVSLTLILTGCGNDNPEEDSMAPLLEKAAKEQGIDSQTVKSRESHTPRIAPKETSAGQ